MAGVARLPRARRRWPIFAIAAVVLVLVLLGLLSGFYVELLWFNEDVGLGSVFWRVFWTRVTLVLAFAAAFFVAMYANLLIVRRFAPSYRPVSPEEEVIDRYRGVVDPYMKWILPGVSLLFALFAASGVAGLWQRFLLWRHGAGIEFGQPDPEFGRDAAFFVFRLPFLQFVQGWLFSSLVVITIIVAGAHYLWGGIRVQAIGEKVTPTVKAHLSVLLGLIVLVKAWGYRLGQFDLLTSERGVVTGASYTDVNAQLPALRILVIIAILTGVLFLVNIRFRGWALPAIAIGLLALTSIVAGAAYPAFVQKFRVEPQELQRERQYIERNLDATRFAYGIDDRNVDLERRSIEPEVTAEDVEQNPDTIQNIRLWDPDTLLTVYGQLQQIRRYYAFSDVDVDRYEVVEDDGTRTRRVVMISGREISQSGLPEDRSTWQNRHLFYTHGYGYVASRVDRVSREGQPVFVVQDIPPRGAEGEDLEVDSQRGQRLYYGEQSDVPFIVVNTEQEEFDRPEGAGEAEGALVESYDGEGGIGIGGLFRKLAFAWRFRDVNLLISDLVTSESRILINRDLESRVQRVAPFLRFDHDPYMAVVDGELKWIWDAYTTTDTYPYSDIVDLGTELGGAHEGRINYIRNSVKVVIDAYDGTMEFHIVDTSDPIVLAWQAAFPELFADQDEPSDNLREHFRYPEDLFVLQASQYASYHVEDAEDLYSGEDFWAVPSDPHAGEEGRALPPYYILMRLPGEEEERFMLFTPFTPVNRPNMIGWMAANSDPDDYGRITAFEFQAGQSIPGPQQIAARINQDAVFSQQRTLFGQRGSQIQFGNLLAIPVEDSFLYVQPVYLRSEQSPIPELRLVILVHGETVTVGSSLTDALQQSFGDEGEQPPEEEPEEPAAPGVAQTVEQLLEEAAQHFARADGFLREGDLEGYAREVRAAQEAVEEANRIARGEAAPEEGQAEGGGGGG